MVVGVYVQCRMKSKGLCDCFGGLIPEKFIYQSMNWVEGDCKTEICTNFPFLISSVWLPETKQ